MSKVMVYGYGESGQWSEKLLRSKGYNVTIVDDKKGLQKGNKNFKKLLLNIPNIVSI